MKKLMWLIIIFPAVMQGQIFVQSNAGWHMQNGSTVTVQGNVESFSDLSGEGILTAGGDAMQTFSMHGFGISNLLIDNPANLQLFSALNIAQSLQLLRGNIFCGDNDIMLGENTGIISANGLSIHTNGMGKIKKKINSDLSGYLVAVGNGTEAVPVSWTTTGHYNNAMITISAKAMASPGKPGDISDYVENYWIMETTGLNAPVKTDAWYAQSRIMGNQYQLQGFYRDESSAWKTSAFAPGASAKKMSALISGRSTELFVMSEPRAGMLVFPNPTKSMTTVEVYAQTAEPAFLKLVDVRGRIVDTKAVVVTSGINRFSMGLVGLVPGSYMLQIAGKNILYTKKLVKL